MVCSIVAEAPLTAIVLAAQREGRLDPLAEEAGVSHKCLVPIQGRPLLTHVLDALASVPGLARVRISVEPGADLDLATLGARALARGIILEPVASRPSISDSVYMATEGLDGPFIVTTADNVLLTAGAVERVGRRLLGGDDAVLAMSRREHVLSAHPEGQRRFYRFKDGFFSNCNLYGLSRNGLKMAESFRQGGQFAKNPARIARAFGLINLVILRYGLVSLDRAMARLSRRFGVRVSALQLEDGAHAIDVDNPRTYAIASILLERRAA